MGTKKRKGGLSLSPATPFWKITAIGLLLLSTILLVGGTATLSHLGIEPWKFYLNLANPNMKFVSVQAGLRKEQTADIFAKALNWNDEQKGAFIATAAKRDKDNPEGVFFPSNYWVHKTATAEEVAHMMIDQFHKKVNDHILSKNSTNFKQKLNLDTALRIASIIQREAAGPDDMKVISGVIWNRLFKGMTLDMDATLQYSKGVPGEWWPKVTATDKKIDSLFNTYKHKGLPPSAISNPSLDALYAAYNPSKTNCIFYIHDNDRNFHCSVTYEQHKENIATYLFGRK